MNINRREFMRIMGLAEAAGLVPSTLFAAQKVSSDLYEMPAFGNARIMHFTDCHQHFDGQCASKTTTI